MPNRPVIAALIALPLAACAGGEWPPLAGPPRPKTRTTDDYLSKRRDH